VAAAAADGGADPLRALTEILCRQGFAPSYDKIPSSLPSARPSSMVSLATMSRRVDQATAAARDLLKVDAARERKAAATYSRKAQGASAVVDSRRQG